VYVRITSLPICGIPVLDRFEFSQKPCGLISKIAFKNWSHYLLHRQLEFQNDAVCFQSLQNFIDDAPADASAPLPKYRHLGPKVFLGMSR